MSCVLMVRYIMWIIKLEFWIWITVILKNLFVNFGDAI